MSFSSSSCLLRRRSTVSSFFSPLLSFAAPPFSSASAWAIQFRRHDSLIPRSFTTFATGLLPRRASSTARCPNSGGCGAGTRTSFLVALRHLRWGVRATGGSSRSFLGRVVASWACDLVGWDRPCYACPGRRFGRLFRFGSKGLDVVGGRVQDQV